MQYTLTPSSNPPSSGQPQAGFAHLRLPLISDVRPLRALEL
jgi:hypothetical protein